MVLPKDVKGNSCIIFIYLPLHIYKYTHIYVYEMTPVWYSPFNTCKTSISTREPEPWHWCRCGGSGRFGLRRSVGGGVGLKHHDPLKKAASNRVNRQHDHLWRNNNIYLGVFVGYFFQIKNMVYHLLGELNARVTPPKTNECSLKWYHV